MAKASGDRAGSDIGPFSIVPDWIIRSTASDRAKVLYALIGRYADRSGEAFPSRKTLAVLMRTSLNSIDRAVKELVDLGALEVLPRVDGAGDRTSNLYRLIYAMPGGVAPLVGPPLPTGDTTGGPMRGATVAPRVGRGTITTGTKQILNETVPDQEQRRSAATFSDQKAENYRALVRVCHDVLDEVERGAVAVLDDIEEMKCRAARAKLDYRNVHAAARSATWQRKHRRKAK